MDSNNYMLVLKNTLDDVIISFFQELHLTQENLDDEFKKVLYENLWDLYES